MKTKNNVQKAVVKSLAVVISLVLISITVNAQDFWKSLIENSSFNVIATAMVETTNDKTSSFTNADLSTFETETEIEKALELESWMTEESRFNSSFNLEIETESSLQLENWMTSDNLFDANDLSMETDTEESLKLEDWMLKDNFHNNSVEAEQPLQLESWMIAFEKPVR